MKPHPESGRLAAAMRRCLPLAGAWQGDLYRFAPPAWSTVTHLLTGEGARLHGGRWCPGGFPLVNVSLDPETALAEALAKQRRYSLSVAEAMPLTLNAVRATFHHVLDLTDGSVRHRLAVSWDRMLGETWWNRQEQDEEAITQAIGRLAWEAGLEALLVPSAARPGGVNLVYFPDNRSADGSLTIYNPSQLPRASE